MGDEIKPGRPQPFGNVKFWDPETSKPKPLSISFDPDAAAPTSFSPIHVDFTAIAPTATTPPPTATSTPGTLSPAEWQSGSREFLKNKTEVLHAGDTGPAVALYKEYARAAGIALDDKAPANTFTARDSELLRNWQQANGKKPDGVVGDQTWSYLALRVDVRPGREFVGSPGTLATQVKPGAEQEFVTAALQTSERLRGSTPDANTIVATFTRPATTARDLQRNAANTPASGAMRSAATSGGGTGQGTAAITTSEKPPAGPTLEAILASSGAGLPPALVADITAAFGNASPATLGQLQEVLEKRDGAALKNLIGSQLADEASISDFRASNGYKLLPPDLKKLVDDRIPGATVELLSNLSKALTGDFLEKPDAEKRKLIVDAIRISNESAESKLPDSVNTLASALSGSANAAQVQDLKTLPAFVNLKNPTLQQLLLYPGSAQNVSATLRIADEQGRIQPLSASAQKTLDEIKNSPNLSPQMRAEAAVRLLWSNGKGDNSDIAKNLSDVIKNPVFAGADPRMKSILIHGADSQYVRDVLANKKSPNLSTEAQAVLANAYTNAKLSPTERAELAVQLFDASYMDVTTLANMAGPNARGLEGVTDRRSEIQNAVMAQRLSAYAPAG